MHMDTQGQNTIATADVSSIAKTFVHIMANAYDFYQQQKLLVPFTAIAQFITLAIV